MDDQTGIHCTGETLTQGKDQLAHIGQQIARFDTR